MRRAVAVVIALLLAAVTLGLVWLAGMRDKTSAVVAVQRRVNRDVLNPKQMATAGQPGASAALLRHTGRRSGRVYETPVGVERAENGFVIALVYGPQSDWVRNVLAAGHAMILHEGREYRVDQPRVVPVEDTAESFAATTQRSLRLFNVTEALTLRICDDAEPDPG